MAIPTHQPDGTVMLADGSSINRDGTPVETTTVETTTAPPILDLAPEEVAEIAATYIAGSFGVARSSEESGADFVARIASAVKSLPNDLQAAQKSAADAEKRAELMNDEIKRVDDENTKLAADLIEAQTGVSKLETKVADSATEIAKLTEAASKLPQAPATGKAAK